MKRLLLSLLAAIALISGTMAQSDQMNVNFKDGKVLHLPVSDIDSVTWNDTSDTDTPANSVLYKIYNPKDFYIEFHGDEVVDLGLNGYEVDGSLYINTWVEHTAWNNFNHVFGCRNGEGEGNGNDFHFSLHSDNTGYSAGTYCYRVGKYRTLTHKSANKYTSGGQIAVNYLGLGAIHRISLNWFNGVVNNLSQNFNTDLPTAFTLKQNLYLGGMNQMGQPLECMTGKIYFFYLKIQEKELYLVPAYHNNQYCFYDTIGGEYYYANKPTLSGVAYIVE